MSCLEVHVAVGGVGDKCDAFVVLYLNGTPVGRTETIHNVPNPGFVQSFKFDKPVGGEVLKVEVYSEEKPNSQNLHDQHLLGAAETPFSAVTDNLRQITSLLTQGGQARGLFKKENPPVHVYLQAEYVNPNADVLTMQWSATDLTNLDGIFNKSDPVLFLARMVQDGSFLPVFRTEVVQSNLNPVWVKKNITLQRLCNGDLDRPLLVQVFDMDNGEKHRKLIGQVQTTARALLDLPTLFLQSAANKPSGSLRPLHMRLLQNPPFSGFAPGACAIQSIQGVLGGSQQTTAAPIQTQAALPIHDKLSQGVDMSMPLPVAAAAPLATLVPPPLHDKLSQGFAGPSEPVAFATPLPVDMAPMAVPIAETSRSAASPPAPVAAPVNWLVKINTQDGGSETTVVFINSTPRVLDVAWVGYEGEETSYAQIAPGKRYEQPTYSSHVWKLSFADSREPLAYFLVPLSNSFVDVRGVNQLSIGANLTPAQPGAAATPTTLIFRNQTPQALSIQWVESGDSAGEQFAVLHPGQTYRQDTYATHVWKATYAGSHDALCFVTAPPAPTQVDVQGFNKVVLTPLGGGGGGGYGGGV
ncbi:Aste57867_24300 [Aphanomyces stellatus]|uniref:Aste57867_24300 protein n=1 Tax=Aphanomyces stellatus TaxID=120398 RepID=A0A485LQT1_9STRA|nr:hypothetical protein As57867_024225 [Aphanomyces stellatus]VFU00940.1 Aste57867_24300 [Aphanomyces stellatus]